MRGMIFDVDGTLCDTLGIWQGLGARFLAERGILAQPDLDDRVKHMGMHKSAAFIKTVYRLPESEAAIIRAWRDMIADFYMHRAQAKPGLTAFLTALQERDIRCAVATVNGCELVDAMFHRLEIAHFFEARYCGLDEKCGKDTPALYLKAARDIQLEICDTWVFEDNHSAARTACRVGFQVLGMCDRHHSPEELFALKSLARASFSDFHQALDWLLTQSP